jgi:hypothetical protein
VVKCPLSKRETLNSNSVLPKTKTDKKPGAVHLLEGAGSGAHTLL